jgi:hypothetical protein
MKVEKTEGCWLWTGSVSPDGYGRMWRNRKLIGAHRLSWELHNGPVPDGLQVLHNCPGGDNRACVNPAHLFLGTNADKIAKGRQPRGEDFATSRLNEASVRDIRAEYAAGKATRKELAAKYGVAHGTIHAITEGRSWKHLLTAR